MVGLNCIFESVCVHGNAAGCFEADFGIEPDCNADTNFKVTFSKKKVRIRIVQIRYAAVQFLCEQHLCGTFQGSELFAQRIGFLLACFIMH